jgi:hypothetical protein
MVAAMSDDLDLTRLFADAPAPPDGEAFVARIAFRIAWYRRLALALPAGAVALLVFAIWATWPAVYVFSRDALSGILLIAHAISTFFTSPTGMFAATVLLLTAAAWTRLFEWLRGDRI